MENFVEIKIHNPQQIPSIEDIQKILETTEKILLKFLYEIDKVFFVKELKDKLENIAVFDSGGDEVAIWITIVKTINEEFVKKNLHLILNSTKRFSSLSETLVNRLKKHLSLDRLELDVKPHEWRLSPNIPYRGAMDAEWEYAFHGHHCRFKNIQTGQIIDVALAFKEYGVLDPSSFQRYIKSTPIELQLVDLFSNNFYQNLSKTFKILTKLGFLKEIENSTLSIKGFALSSK